MDIHDEIYRNKTPDVTTQEGKATPDSGVDVTSLLDTKAYGNDVLPETIVEESEGEKSTTRSANEQEKQEDERPVSAVDEGLGGDDKRECETQELVQEEAEEEDGEEEDPEMTEEDKEEMYRAVICGDIDLLDDLLDKPGADINMEWFGENLLMAAIRNDEESMAEFLIDNGVQPSFKATQVDMKNKNPIPAIDLYSVSCRQVAYDYNMNNIVELIDELNGDLWPFVKPRERVIRMKRSLEEKLRERGEWVSEEEDAGQEGDDEGSIVSMNGTRGKRRKKRKDLKEEDAASSTCVPHRSSNRRSNKPESEEGNDKHRPGERRVRECVTEVKAEKGKAVAASKTEACKTSKPTKDNVSSGYDTLSHSSSVIKVDNVFQDIPVPLNPPQTPHKYRQTKSSLTRMRLSQPTKPANNSYFGVMDENITQNLSLESYSSVNKYWKSPSLRRKSGIRLVDQHTSPFAERLHTFQMPSSTSCRSHSQSNESRCKWQPMASLAVINTSYDSNNVSFRREATLPNLPSCSKQRPLANTVRRYSTLLHGNGRTTSRHVLTCVSPRYRDMSADMLAPVTSSPRSSRPMTVCSKRLSSPWDNGHNRPYSSSGNWKASTTANWAETLCEGGKRKSHNRKYSPAGHLKIGRSSGGVSLSSYPEPNSHLYRINNLV